MSYMSLALCCDILIRFILYGKYPVFFSNIKKNIQIENHFKRENTMKIVTQANF